MPQSSHASAKSRKYSGSNGLQPVRRLSAALPNSEPGSITQCVQGVPQWGHLCRTDCDRNERWDRIITNRTKISGARVPSRPQPVARPRFGTVRHRVGLRRTSTINRCVHLDDATLSEATERIAAAVQGGDCPSLASNDARNSRKRRRTPTSAFEAETLEQWFSRVGTLSAKLSICYTL